VGSVPVVWVVAWGVIVSWRTSILQYLPNSGCGLLLSVKSSASQWLQPGSTPGSLATVALNDVWWRSVMNRFPGGKSQPDAVGWV
jgi:hypothetical protein